MTAVPVGERAPMSTPARLRLHLGAIVALSALVLAIGDGELSAARRAVKTVGHDAAPSIIAAQDIAFSLADLDANVGNELLGTAAHRALAEKVVAERTAKATHTLVDAAENVTYGEAEKRPINDLFAGLLAYETKTSEANVRANGGDARRGIYAYDEASASLHAKLLPAADDLDAANRSYLDAAYQGRRTSSAAARVLVYVVGVGLVVALLLVQIFLRARTRRILNPALVGATLLALATTQYLASRFDVLSADLRVAVDDAFESMHALVRARTLAYDANGDETRWLLDQGLDGGDGFADAFDAKGKALDDLLGKATRNVTFAGEADALRAATAAFARYRTIDRDVRALSRSGKRAEAIDLCIGDRADGSNAAFARFDDAIMSTYRINRAEFDAAIEWQEEALAIAEIATPLLCALVAALAFLGIRARLREYA